MTTDALIITLMTVSLITSISLMFSGVLILKINRKNTKYKKALWFYADEETYWAKVYYTEPQEGSFGEVSSYDIEEDAGEIARKALESEPDD